VQPDSSIKRVLIYRVGSLGDTTVALPCFHLIARSYPAAERVLLTNFPVHVKAPAAGAVLGDSGLVQRYMRYSVGTRNPLELLTLAREIRRFKPEVLVYLMPVRPMPSVRRDALFFRWVCGVKRIVGLPGQAELERSFDAASGRYEAEAHRLARTLAELGDAEPERIANWDLVLTEAERGKARAMLGELANKPLVVCGPGTKMQAKDWGQENWRALLERVGREHPGCGLALIGAAEDREVSEFAAAGWQGPKVNLCGALKPRETAAVLEGARVFLGPDSGPMHLAAATDVPCVIAFSARGLPGVWYPVGERHQIIYHQTSCYGCNLESCEIEQRRCLTSIGVDEMASAFGRVFAAQRG
jgi:heptosyltransferase III